MTKIRNRDRTLVLNDKFSRFQGVRIAHCHYCGVALTQESATREHIKPVSDGGDNRPRNIKLACKPCNQARKSYDYAAFFAYMRPVREARALGLPIPSLPKFTPPANPPKISTIRRNESKANRKALENLGYTKELLFKCNLAASMRNAGHDIESIAAHLSMSGKVVRMLCDVGRKSANQRLAYLRKLREKLKADPDFYAIFRAYTNAKTRAWNQRIRESDPARYDQMKAEKRNERAAWRQRLESDPAAWEMHMAEARAWYASLTPEDRDRIYYAARRKSNGPKTSQDPL